MKVAFISTCYPTKTAKQFGVFVHQQALALTKLGIECHIIQPVNWYPPFGLSSFHPYWREGALMQKNMHDVHEGIKVHHPRVFKKMPSRFFKQSYPEMTGIAIAAYIKKTPSLKNIDILYAQFLSFEGYVGTIVKRKLGIPLAAIALGDDVHAWPERDKKLIYQLHEVFKYTDLLLANSKRLAEDTQLWMQPDNIRDVKVLYHGIDTEKFSPARDQNEIIAIRQRFNLLDGKYLLCVGAPVRAKGWIELLDAIMTIKTEFSGWKLLMVVPEMKSHDALDLTYEIKKRTLSEYCIVLGQLPHDELALLYKAVNAFILPSYNEGMSNSVLEAMAVALPVITTKVGGHPEMINSNEDGILINSKSTEEIVSCLLKIIHEDLSEMSKKARKRMIELGSYQQNQQKLIDWFSEYIVK